MRPAPALPRWLRAELPYARRAVELDGQTVTFVDHGPEDARPVLLVHGNPTWSYLWRKVIGELAGHRLRLIAPDLLGFGTSDKPRRASAHQLEMHISTVARLMEALGAEDFVAVGQDWGGPIACGVGERLGAAGLVLGNTAVLKPARPFRPKGFHRFSHMPLVSDAVFRGTLFPVPVMDRVQGDRASIGLKEKLAYAWPFLGPLDRAGALGLARMVPNGEGHPSTPTMDRIGAWVESFEGPAALVWARRDPILGRGLRRHHEALPQATVRECDAGHFSQEEVPEFWAAAIEEVVSGL
ncbi:MAG: alpha/beta fold hydrolase [Myxococcota bacterium]|nr:alpha/beta fold hydrolase [Myxococcota bacterium]